MPKPLSLFLPTPITGWTRQAAYGPDNPLLILRSDGPAGAVVSAAVTGRLTARLPGHGPADPTIPIAPPDTTDPLPTLAFLYLYPSFGELLGRSNAFRDKLNSEFPSLYFTYVVDGPSLEGILQANLARAPVGADPAPSSAELIRLFLAGVIDVSVHVGDPIGQINPASGIVLLPFAVSRDVGPVDPSFFYDRMRDFVEQGSLAVDSLLAIAPTVWPVLGGTAAEVITQTSTALYPYAALVEAKTRLGLSRADWRTIGDNQKAQYRERLLQRFGRAPAGSTAPVYEFNTTDWANLFQLEAVAEFYVNFREPWQPGSSPLDPAANPPTAANLDVGRLDFVDLGGVNATAAGTTVTIGDAGVDFARIRAHASTGDLLVLAADTARPGRSYRITRKDAGAGTLTLDAAPTLPGPSAWSIRARPAIMLIDPLGPRAAGPVATRGNDVGNFAEVILDRQVGRDRTRVNPFFDTISFSADTAHPADHVGPLRTYRILRTVASTVLVEGKPEFNTSDWQIQAGIGGAVDPAPFANGPLLYDLGTDERSGFDHFDAMLFVVYGDQVRKRERWNTYTARGHATRMQQSTVDGNRGFDFITWRSGESSRRNYCVKMVDWGTVDTGADLCANARYFFDPQSATPPAAVSRDVGGTQPSDTSGKTEIRLHFTRSAPGEGVHHCDSAGCIVSGNMMTLRSDLASIVRFESLVTAGSDSNVAVLVGATQNDLERAGGIWQTNRASSWHQGLIGRIWVIRPDQLPIGYARPAGL